MTTGSRASVLPSYAPGGFWDEMFEGPGQVRPHYAELARRLATLSAAEVQKRQRAADLSFQAQGITFSVNQDPSGPEKTMPFDLVPRIVMAEEWTRIERGLEQRVRALNLFLHDIYHEQRILRTDLIPAELVLGARGYRREFRNVDMPLGVYTHVVGSDLVRDGRGTWFVLEDNLRVPSGVSYVVENRRVLKRVWPQIFADYRVRPVEGYPQDLLEVLRAVAPGSDDPTVVLLTPGVHNSAFFEHAFLAKAMGIEMVQGSDLFVDDATVYMRTTSGRRRIDVIYQRVDDDFIDPLAFRRDSFLGVPGLLATYRMGRVSLANALGTGGAEPTRFIADFRTAPEILAYVNGAELASYSQRGVVTPDHIIRTKNRPLVLPAPEAGRLEDFAATVREAVEKFVAAYDAYFVRENAAVGGVNSKLDASPRVVLVPGVGLFGLGRSAKDASIAADLAENTVKVVTDAEAIGRYEPLPS